MRRHVIGVFLLWWVATVQAQARPEPLDGQGEPIGALRRKCALDAPRGLVCHIAQRGQQQQSGKPRHRCEPGIF